MQHRGRLGEWRGDSPRVEPCVTSPGAGPGLMSSWPFLEAGAGRGREESLQSLWYPPDRPFYGSKRLMRNLDQIDFRSFTIFHLRSTAVIFHLFINYVDGSNVIISHG